jgi:hypothetical protein
MQESIDHGFRRRRFAGASCASQAGIFLASESVDCIQLTLIEREIPVHEA